MSVLKKAAFIGAVLMTPAIVLAGFFGGWSLLPYMLGAGMGTFLAISLKTKQIIIYGALAIVAFGLAALFHGNGVLLPLLVAATGLVSIKANQVSAGALSLLPANVMIIGWQADIEVWPTVMIACLGLVYAAFAIRKLGISKPPKPLPAASAMIHGILLAALTGVAAWLVMAFDVPNGYWIVVTIAMIVRTEADETVQYMRDRALGTLLGSAVTLFVLFLFPPWLVLVVLAGCVMLYLSYALLGAYAAQVTYLTIILLISASAGSKAVGVTVAVERSLWTLVAIGCTIGVYWAAFLAENRWHLSAKLHAKDHQR